MNKTGHWLCAFIGHRYVESESEISGVEACIYCYRCGHFLLLTSKPPSLEVASR